VRTAVSTASHFVKKMHHVAARRTVGSLLKDMPMRPVREQ